MDELNEAFSKMKSAMDSSVEHLKTELTKLRAGKASPSMVSDLLVDYYGSPTPIGQVANVSNSDSRTINIQPWEKNMLGPIEQAIFASNIGVTPMNDGEQVRITIPPMTEERRKDIVKQVKAAGEDCKVSIRKSRQKGMDAIKAAVKDGLSEDMGKDKEAEVQNIVNDYTASIGKIIDAKEKEVMTV